MARIIPTDHEPGAREAGTIDFVDRYLSGSSSSTPSRTAAASRRSPASGPRRGGGASRSCARPMSTGSPRSTRSLGRHSTPNSRRSTSSAGRSSPATGPQGSASEWRARTRGRRFSRRSPRPSSRFVPLLAMHTRQGFYADPIYGGNKDQIGWKVIGFPGPSSLMEVFTGRYSALPWFAEGEEQKISGGQSWRIRQNRRARRSASSARELPAPPSPRC